MSVADKIFCNMCEDILNNGCDTKGEDVRPIWTDTSEKAYTIKKFGVCNRYDLRKEFPAITLRPTNLSKAYDEILWIYQKKSNNVKDLNSKIWDSWADTSGSIGKAYGYQVGSKYCQDSINYKQASIGDMQRKYYSYHSYPSFETSVEEGLYGKKEKLLFYLDQMDSVLYNLKQNPYSRRIIINLYNLDELYQMNLYPCAYSCTFNVTTDKDYNKPILNLLLNQRSNDILVANNWNVSQYAIFLMMVAQVSDMIPGELVHMISDAHIYDRHVLIVKDLIKRTQYPAPIVKLDPEIRSFYDFTESSLIVEDYKTGLQIKNIPVAV